jgi:hypothetical protein
MPGKLSIIRLSKYYRSIQEDMTPSISRLSTTCCVTAGPKNISRGGHDLRDCLNLKGENNEILL